MVAKKGVAPGEDFVASFLAANALDGARSFKKLGRPPSAFEIKVYKALRRNPFAPEVPCHRVVKTDRSIGGFDGTMGDTEKVRKKKAMLEGEGVVFSTDGIVDAECVHRLVC